ncbi:hypothetical protein [Amycolatopsis sp. NPDC051903]|uniref:hypothetical protein n=1 Tax=Amycolatopsis sp. NPDC051903 TaxID=3363936 RepID=UPI00379D5BB7
MGKKKERKSWTAAGAARAARDAQVATAKYLRSTDLAMRVEASSLSRQFQINLRTYAGNRDAARLAYFGALGYTDRQIPSNLTSAARMVLDDDARNLAEAQLYVVSPQMCDVVLAAAQTLTRDDLALVGPEDLPSPTGLIMLPHAVISRAVDGDLTDTRAITWTTPATAFFRSPKHRKVMEYPAARVAAYYGTHGPVRPDNWTEFLDYARSVDVVLPPLIPDARRPFVFHHDPSEDDPDVMRRMTHAARDIARRQTDAAGDGGEQTDQVVGEYVPGSEIDDSDHTFVLRFLYAFWRLCDQRIGVQDQAPPTHSARVAAERLGAPAEIRVVQVRRPEQSAEQPAEDAAAPARDWQHRWVVRMHKVRQWYPSEQTHKVIYRGPYIKGPADKPLLGGDVVRAVTR